MHTVRVSLASLALALLCVSLVAMSGTDVASTGPAPGTDSDDCCGDGQEQVDFFFTWQTIYPDTLTDEAFSPPANGCLVCHTSPGGGEPWNDYGWDIRTLLQSGSGVSEAIFQVESVDSDQDPTGSTNLEEITADTQPGWTDGPNNTHHFEDGSTLAGQMPPNTTGDLDPAVSPFTDLRNGLAGTNGLPVLSGDGTVQGGTLVTLSLSNGLPGGSAFLVLGVAILNAPFKFGVLVPTPNIILSGLPLDGGGGLDIAFPWPDGLPSGATLYWQYWIPDAGGPVGFAASNGLATTQP